MASRRYKIGKHPVYDKAFDLLKTNSAILNPTGAPPSAYSVNLGDATTLKSLLLERRGFEDNPEIEDGYFLKGESGEKTASLLLAAKEQIDAVELQFEGQKQTATNAGKHPPKDMSEDLKSELLKAEARVDIIASEIDTLERFLTKFMEKEGATADANILRKGPEGSGKLSGGMLCEIDGQTVTPDKAGVLRIDEKRSKYHGMKTSDYFQKVVLPWKRENAKLLRAYVEKCKSGEISGAQTAKPRAPWPERPKEKS